MEVIVEKVLERDIDLLMINKFIYDKKVLNLFLNKINCEGYSVKTLQHSLSDSQGESDITIIVEKDNHKIGLLIEDKIDAIAMPNQRERYNIRGQRGIDNKLYDEFYVFMIAPLDYLKNNNEAHLYENQISYEELKDVMKDDIYAVALIEKAIEEKKNGYIVREHSGVTQFWEKYYEYIRNNYPTIKINEVHGPRGESAMWPELLTYYPNVKIIQKSDRGYIDLTFSKMSNYINIFNKYVLNHLNNNMTIEKTGKSMAIRMIFPKIDFRNDFDNYSKELKECLDKALELYNLLNKIDINAMYNEINNNKADIKSLEDFRRLYPKGIIVNYDLRETYRSSKETLETIADVVDYPYVQRYQTGINTKTQLFIIKDNTLYKLKRVEENNPDSKYMLDSFDLTVSEDFYKDKNFYNIKNNPVKVFPEKLLEIIHFER